MILKHNIDAPFISHIEQKREDVHFQRIDADVTDTLKAEDTEGLEEAEKELQELFRKVMKQDNLNVKVEKLKDEKISAMMTLSEESRRMQDMMKMYGMDANMFGGGSETLVLNAGHPLVQYIQEHKEGENTEMICEQLYDMAVMSHKQLSPEQMTRFLERSNQIMMMLTEK